MNRSFFMVITIALASAALSSCESTKKQPDGLSEINVSEAIELVNGIQSGLRSVNGGFTEKQNFLRGKKETLLTTIRRCETEARSLTSKTACLRVRAVAWDLLGQLTDTNTTDATAGMAAVSLGIQETCSTVPNGTPEHKHCGVADLYTKALKSRLAARQIDASLKSQDVKTQDLTVHYQTFEDAVLADWPGLTGGGPEAGLARNLKMDALCSVTQSFVGIQGLVGNEGGSEMRYSARSAISAGVANLQWAVCEGGEIDCDPNACAADPESDACLQPRVSKALDMCLNINP